MLIDGIRLIIHLQCRFYIDWTDFIWENYDGFSSHLIYNCAFFPLIFNSEHCRTGFALLINFNGYSIHICAQTHLNTVLAYNIESNEYFIQLQRIYMVLKVDEGNKLRSQFYDGNSFTILSLSRSLLLTLPLSLARSLAPFHFGV